MLGVRCTSARSGAHRFRFELLSSPPDHTNSLLGPASDDLRVYVAPVDNDRREAQHDSWPLAASPTVDYWRSVRPLLEIFRRSALLRDGSIHSIDRDSGHAAIVSPVLLELGGELGHARAVFIGQNSRAVRPPDRPNDPGWRSPVETPRRGGCDHLFCRHCKAATTAHPRAETTREGMIADNVA